MVKKILFILMTALCCVSCEENTIQESDVFVVKGVELNEYTGNKYKYRYYLHWKMRYYDKTFIEDTYFYSNNKYELGDTLRLIHTKEK